jgi:hypothetical protein
MIGSHHAISPFASIEIFWNKKFCPNAPVIPEKSFFRKKGLIPE